MKKAKSQADLVLKHMETHGSITSYESFELFGCTRLSARIYDLRKRGIGIKSDTRVGKNRYGAPVSFVVYSLEVV